MKKNWVEIVFWGSCWGLMEASLGYMIHVLALPFPGLPGFLLFPCAFILMHKAVTSTGKQDIVIQMSMIAAGLKLLDFMIPGNDPIRILNPALSILMEGVAVYAVILLRKPIPLSSTLLMGLLWRGAFLIYMVSLSQYGLPAGLVTNGFLVAFNFLVMESSINALLMSATLQIDQAQFNFHPKWQLAGMIAVLTVTVQWML